MGGIHLLDEATGTYNESYVQKYFSCRAGGVDRMRTAPAGDSRWPRETPRAFGDGRRSPSRICRISTGKRGPGTRLLCDYLVKQAGIDSSRSTARARGNLPIPAWRRWWRPQWRRGLGIYRLRSCTDWTCAGVPEQYDLLVSLTRWSSPPVQRFLRCCAARTAQAPGGAGRLHARAPRPHSQESLNDAAAHAFERKGRRPHGGRRPEGVYTARGSGAGRGRHAA